jgi:hypothetical protein
MNQPHWTVTRCWISHPGARRRWDKAYQMLLGVAGPSTTEGRDGVDLRSQPEESRQAGDCHLRSRLDPAPSSKPVD